MSFGRTILRNGRRKRKEEELLVSEDEQTESYDFFPTRRLVFLRAKEVEATNRRRKFQLVKAFLIIAWFNFDPVRRGFPRFRDLVRTFLVLQRNKHARSD